MSTNNSTLISYTKFACGKEFKSRDIKTLPLIKKLHRKTCSICADTEMGPVLYGEQREIMGHKDARTPDENLKKIVKENNY